MININFSFEIKNIEEAKEIITLLNNSSVQINRKEGNDDETICKKCWSNKRFVNLWARSFYTCDSCSPRKDWKFSNKISNSPDWIHCPECSSYITKKSSKYWDYYKCNCGFKVDSHDKSFSNLINEYE